MILLLGAKEKEKEKKLLDFDRFLGFEITNTARSI